MAGGEGGFVPEIEQRDFLAQQQRAANVLRGDGGRGHEDSSQRLAPGSVTSSGPIGNHANGPNEQFKSEPLDAPRIPIIFLFCSFKQWLRSGGFMQDVSAPLAEFVRLVFHSDDNNPGRVHRFADPNGICEIRARSAATVAEIHREGMSASGPYPAAVAKALLDECERRVREAGHPLRVTGEEAAIPLTNRG